MIEASMNSVDGKLFRSAVGALFGGVTVMTTRGPDGVDVAAQASILSAVSMDPPTILWSIPKAAPWLHAFAQATHWAAHVLADGQEELLGRFVTPSGRGFHELPVSRTETGVPLIPGCRATFECRKSFQYDVGDQVIFIGEVDAVGHTEKQPLAFNGGTFSTAPPFPTSGADVLSSDLAYLLVRAFFLMRAPVSDGANALGLTIDEVHVLGLLSPGEMSRDAVVASLSEDGIANPRELVSRLCRHGLVRSTAGDVDQLTITDEGRRTLHALMAIGRAREADLVEDLTPEETQVLKVLLSRLSGAAAARDRKILEALWAPDKSLFKQLDYGSAPQ